MGGFPCGLLKRPAPLAAVSRMDCRKGKNWGRETSIPSAGTSRCSINICSMNEYYLKGLFILFELIVSDFLLRLVFFLDHILFCPWRSGRGWTLWRQAEWCLGRPIQQTPNLGPSEGIFASKLAGGNWCFLPFSKIWVRCPRIWVPAAGDGHDAICRSILN